ncbi:UNVERIFIED_CONTAM: CBL-interacting serine/threonine-protein kinase [Sesamum latifolium]|uniref:non-specific serine/threonine protein kinase n=1 Tax=Sesamum latifolium TaxID=2727402 RepID=A0AAW2TTF6_9LAMI
MASRSSGGGGSGSGSSSGRTRVGRYELGRTLGEGTFAKVKFARNVETGENVAIKILDKEKVLKHKMIGQIKREISTMKLIRHPNVIRMYEVMASKTKIYIVMEFVTGGELFDKIATKGRLKEDEARKYFQQLINAVDYCHSRGVYHRDLKPENLLLDANGVLKVSDFGLSALPQQVREDGLLHTTCGTPNYVAPEVINNKGYDGAKADLWSCGVILFVLMAGFLPFEESNLMALYKKIFKADFSCPAWFSSSAKKLIKRILDPNPSTRITIAEILENEWFKKGYKPPVFEHEDVTLDDVNAIFNESADSPNLVVERREERPPTPVTMNAFELISKSQGLNLNSLFEKQMGLVKRETRFTSKSPANEIISKIEEAAAPMGFDVKKNNYKMKLHGEKSGRKGHLSIATEIFEVAPSLHMVELRKTGGDTLEFHKFYKNLSTGLKDIVWKTGDEAKDEASNGWGFKDLHALAYQDPILLVSSVENTLIPKLDYLESLGFSKADAVGMVLRCPGLFTFSVENNFKPKFKYFAEGMNGRLEELKGFPQYFAFSLEKRIKPRHAEVVQSGVKIALPLMLKTTDEEFRELLRQGS